MVSSPNSYNYVAEGTPEWPATVEMKQTASKQLFQNDSDCAFSYTLQALLRTDRWRIDSSNFSIGSQSTLDGPQSLLKV